MDFYLCTADDYTVDCRCDLGNRWVVVNRADYRSDDHYVSFGGFSDEEEFEYDIEDYYIVRMTRNSVIIGLQLIYEDSESENSDSDSCDSLQCEDIVGEQDIESDDSSYQEETADMTESEDEEDEYWGQY